MTNPSSTRSNIRLAVPSTLGPNAEASRKMLEVYLRAQLGKDTEVLVPESYEQMAKELLSGKVDAAWAPPFVCARIEAMGVRVLMRGVRGGASTYRAALVCRKDANVTLESLEGSSAVWSDRDSVGGYLLPMSFLRDKGLDPARLFFKQEFVGSYQKALEAVHKGTFDVTSVFAPPARAKTEFLTGIDEVWPGHAQDFKVISFTDESPNDGVAVSMSAPAAVVTDLERVLQTMHQSAEGQAVLKDCFHAEKFEVAPRMGYRALYRVALASL